MRYLLGITGSMGSGKTTVAKYLTEKYSFKRMQLSAKMRDIAHEFGIEPNRDFLQGIGKFMREFDDDVWVKYLANRIEKTSSSIVVDDIRRQNEIDYLKPLGFIFIRIESLPLLRRKRIEERRHQKISNEEWERWSNHLTEIQVSELEVDYSIYNNGSIPDLLMQVDTVISKILVEG